MSITQTTTAQKLQMTANEYEHMLFSGYARWCESVTINEREFQKTLANSAINKWYLIEYSKCEKEFQQLTGRYNNLTVADYKRCYNDCTYRMFNIRPTALLQEVKKTQVFGVLKIQGVRIPSLTFNQN